VNVKLTEAQIHMLLSAADYYIEVWSANHDEQGKPDGDLASTTQSQINVLERAIKVLTTQREEGKRVYIHKATEKQGEWVREGE
jgi:hypothetical protein